MPAPAASDPKLAELSRKLLIGSYRRHVFLCVGDSCCDKKEGAAAWDRLKDLLKEKNLSLADGPAACFRTKVGCLRVCHRGPILVVYPEGTWYADMTADRIERLVDEHLVGGTPIAEWVFARNPLPLGEVPA